MLQIPLSGAHMHNCLYLCTAEGCIQNSFSFSHNMKGISETVTSEVVRILQTLKSKLCWCDYFKWLICHLGKWYWWVWVSSPPSFLKFVLKFAIIQLFGAKLKLLCFPARALQHMCKEEIIWHFWTVLLVAPVLLCDDSVWEYGGGCAIQTLWKHRALLKNLVFDSQSFLWADLSSLCTQLDLFCNSYSVSQIISHNEDLSLCLLPPVSSCPH